VYYVQVTAVDTAGQESACSVMASAAARSDVPTSDTTPPTIVIQSARVVNKQALLSGIAGDNVGVVSVKWTDSRGGSGTATGTTNWSFTTPIRPGNTVYTITARDAAGNFKNVSVTLKGN
jgi:hypothetical protein